ncbi:LOW QUALITY PROTEIN: hypothetical protein Cgig2_033823 [Carnegiea gigantea]|uniref:Uncharacterized protein n=1 Tax=Carnegiea gigantea TaxID=171969 RepID=A0A9Q1JTN5_9CARY|nr:LOW QUALITY PROTEIN: hypothetical protein Cgig2_033823 [Carnegiea gigantea]
MWSTVNGRHASMVLRKLGPCNGRLGSHHPWLHKFRGMGGSFMELPFLYYKRQLAGRRCFTLPYSIIIVIWCSSLSRAPLILRQWPSTSPAILHETDALYPSFELAVAREAAEYYELPKLPQVIFYAMLLNEAEKLGVLQGQPSLSSIRAPLNRGSGCMVTGFLKLDSVQGPDRGRVRELVDNKMAQSHVSEVDWRLGSWEFFHLQLFLSLFHKYVVIPPHRMFEYSFFQRECIERAISTRVFPCQYGVLSYLQYKGDGRLHKGILCLELKERVASASPPSRRLPRLMPALLVAEGAAADFELPEIVHATFYIMLLNEAVELGMAHEFTTVGLKSALIGLRWSTFEVWMGYVDHVLRAAHLQRPADEVEVRGPLDGQEEGFGSNAPRPF